MTVTFVLLRVEPVTVTLGRADVVWAETRWPVDRSAAPPGAERSTRRSRSKPVVPPGVVRRVAVPAARRTEAPSHVVRSMALPARRSAVVPWSETETGLPSTVTRSERQESSITFGSFDAFRPGTPMSTMPIGITTSLPVNQSNVVTSRTVVSGSAGTWSWSFLPVTALSSFTSNV